MINNNIPDKNKTIEEDLEFNVDTDYIVDLYLKKPGLDLAEGKYKIIGILTAKHIYKRHGKDETKQIKGNIAPSIGYKVLDIATGKTRLITKKQGIELCRLYGMTNAYIIGKNFEKKNNAGNILQRKPIVYLQPYPANTESFTQDDRIIPIFELDSDGKFKNPITLQVTEEESSKEMWEIIQFELNKREAQVEKANKWVNPRQEHSKLMENLRMELQKESIEIGHDSMFKL